jgi:uncharacterized protein
MTADTGITQNEQLNRYEIVAEGLIAGTLEYRDEGETRFFTRTFIEDAFRGQGLAEALAEYGISQAVAQGRQIQAPCPFVSKYMAEHPELLAGAQTR